MSLISLLVYLIVIGLILYLVGLLPIDATIKRIIQIVVLVIVILWLVQALGLIAGLGSIRIGR
jgi:hypothetical protein